jgi:hypothetical protein
MRYPRSPREATPRHERIQHELIRTSPQGTARRLCPTRAQCEPGDTRGRFGAQKVGPEAKEDVDKRSAPRWCDAIRVSYARDA